MKKLTSIVLLLLLMISCQKTGEDPFAAFTYVASHIPQNHALDLCAGGYMTIYEGSPTVDPPNTSWVWTFKNGTPSSYNGQHPPDIYYNNVGKGDITLTVTNDVGSDVCTMSFNVMACN